MIVANSFYPPKSPLSKGDFGTLGLWDFAPLNDHGGLWDFGILLPPMTTGDFGTLGFCSPQ